MSSLSTRDEAIPPPLAPLPLAELPSSTEASASSSSSSSSPTASAEPSPSSGSSSSSAPSRRDKVASEIVESEQSYVNYLETIALFYRIPLEANALMHADAVSADDLKSLFSQIDVLLAYHRRLLEQLLECQRQWSESSTLGGVFLEIVQFLRLYSNYVNHYPRSQEVLKRMYQSPSSGKLLRQLDEQPEVRGLSLKDYLIMPVQRVPRYILLLQALIKATPPGHADLLELQQAKEKLEEVAEMLEVSQRVSRNGQALMRIQARLCARNAAELHLIQPDRWFVREAKMLERSSAHSTRSKHRNVYLFSDLLLITKSRKADEETTHVLPLADISSVRSSDDGTAIVVQHKSSEFLLACDGAPSDTKSWLTDMVLHFTKAKAKKQQTILKSPSLSPATSPRRPHKSVSIGAVPSTATAATATSSRLLQEASKALRNSSKTTSSTSDDLVITTKPKPLSSSTPGTPTLKRTLSVKSRQEMLVSTRANEREHSSLIIFSSLPPPLPKTQSAVSAPSSPTSSPGRLPPSALSARQLSSRSSSDDSCDTHTSAAPPIERARSSVPFSSFARINVHGAASSERLRAELATSTPRGDSPVSVPTLLFKRPSTPNLMSPKFVGTTLDD